MKIACIGTGFIGVVTTAVWAKLGHQVIGIDIDEKKIELLRQGKVPFYEPGLEELLVETQKSGNLSFTTNYAEAIPTADIVMIMVGTPSAPDGQADLKYVLAAAESAAPHLKENAIVIIKSTVPPGTNAKVKAMMSKIATVDFDFASLPEFLKEGTAVYDTLHPDRVIIGATNEATIQTLKELHAPLTSNILVMKPESAQMAKYGSNVYLAMRITFANQLADLCEKNGADVMEVLEGLGEDKRIGSHYWYPGLGYGGSCFPKDVKEIAAYAKSVGLGDSLFVEVDRKNEERIPKVMARYSDQIGGFSGKKVAVLGLSFKPNTNDTRVAPALVVIPWLLAAGATVVATDPKAIEEIKPLLPSAVNYAADAYEASDEADIVMLLIEWDEYKSLDLGKLKAQMSSQAVFVDTRNQYDKELVTGSGFTYLGIGR
jgi:UDPglucose 6-dehydrogenase